jgi:DNA-binding protein YbaB
MQSAAEILTAIAAQLQRASTMSTVVKELAGELAQLRGVGRTDDDEATVTVDYHGIVVDLRLGDAVVDLDGPTVSQRVLEATRRAIDDLHRQGEPIRAAILQPHTAAGFDTTLGDKLDELYAQIETVERRAGGPLNDEGAR